MNSKNKSEVKSVSKINPSVNNPMRQINGEDYYVSSKILDYRITNITEQINDMRANIKDLRKKVDDNYKETIRYTDKKIDGIIQDKIQSLSYILENYKWIFIAGFTILGLIITIK